MTNHTKGTSCRELRPPYQYHLKRKCLLFFLRPKEANLVVLLLQDFQAIEPKAVCTLLLALNSTPPLCTLVYDTAYICSDLRSMTVKFCPFTNVLSRKLCGVQWRLFYLRGNESAKWVLKTFDDDEYVAKGLGSFGKMCTCLICRWFWREPIVSWNLWSSLKRTSSAEEMASMKIFFCAWANAAVLWWNEIVKILDINIRTCTRRTSCWFLEPLIRVSIVEISSSSPLLPANTVAFLSSTPYVRLLLPLSLRNICQESKRHTRWSPSSNAECLPPFSPLQHRTKMSACKHYLYQDNRLFWDNDIHYL